MSNNETENKLPNCTCKTFLKKGKVYTHRDKDCPEHGDAMMAELEAANRALRILKEPLPDEGASQS